jgi:hypothetical protein
MDEVAKNRNKFICLFIYLCVYLFIRLFSSLALTQLLILFPSIDILAAYWREGVLIIPGAHYFYKKPLVCDSCLSFSCHVSWSHTEWPW